MTHLLFATTLDPAQLFRLVACLLAGGVLGVLYFGSLWWSVGLFAGRRRLPLLLALTAGRLVLLGGSLALAGLDGAAALLSTALGVLLGRFAVMRRLGQDTP